MLQSTFFCCKVYISETQNKCALESIEGAAKLFPEVVVVDKFEDEMYNRVTYTLVSKLAATESCLLKHAVFSMVKAAFEAIDLELHTGSHPRLGVVDHICFYTLGSASLEQVAATAKSLAADIASKLKVPVYTHDAAHKEGRSLDSIRRAFGYYKPNAAGNQWSGGPQLEVLPLEPDEGPAQAVRSKGIVVIGATRWMAYYNIPVLDSDIATVGRIARRVSRRGGGHPSVQAMALAHGDVIEVACILLEPSEFGGDQVQAAVELQGSEEGVTVEKGYFTHLSQEDMIQTYLNFTCS